MYTVDTLALCVRVGLVFTFLVYDVNRQRVTNRVVLNNNSVHKLLFSHLLHTKTHIVVVVGKRRV